MCDQQSDDPQSPTPDQSAIHNRQPLIVNRQPSIVNRQSSIVNPQLAKVVSVIAVGLSLFQLYTAGVGAIPDAVQRALGLGAMTAEVQRAVHLGAILALTFMLRPPFSKARKDRLTVWLVLDLLLVTASLCCCFYVVYYLNDICERRGNWIISDTVVSIVGTLLVLEACRRVIGWLMAGICTGFLLYAYFGSYMPDLFAHKGYGVERIATTLFLTTEGIFGLPIGVAATFVFVFVLFGAFLEVSGGGNFFIDLAYALTGRFSGGPAKASVIASGFMGSVSGSAVANVVATGSFTIPMMKKVGYRPHVAGAIEAAASTGGQLMPPIMGAGAFLMAEFTNTSYLTIIKLALVPAILYYMTVLLFVHFEAQKQGLRGQSRDRLPKILMVIKDGLHFIIPVAALITALTMHVSPMMAGFVAVVSTYVASALRKKSRMGLRRLLQALERGARNAVMVSVACAAAGIIVGIVGLTGQGLNFSSLVPTLAMDIKVLAILLIGLASLVLGMGLPVTASYIVLATLACPALMNMGVPLLVAHMIVFWYSQDANVTPPVSLASFAGAGVAGAHPMRTAFVSWKLAKGLYIIPIVMAYRPLLGGAPWPEVVLTMVTCAAGLLAFAAALDRYFLRRATWLETALLVLASVGLFWPEINLPNDVSIPAYLTDAVGGALLAAVILLQKLYHPPETTEQSAAKVK
ncbi:MAG: TRAP transporter permease [Phycisphaerae bacterium]|nr:TRAP transporter permease [Phycisphaerae bacterium]